MLQFSYKLKVSERVKAKCARHPRYNPERDGRGGIKGGCSTCFSLYDPSGKAHARFRASRVFEEGNPLDALDCTAQQLSNEL